MYNRLLWYKLAKSFADGWWNKHLKKKEENIPKKHNESI